MDFIGIILKNILWVTSWKIFLKYFLTFSELIKSTNLCKHFLIFLLSIQTSWKDNYNSWKTLYNYLLGNKKIKIRKKIQYNFGPLLFWQSLPLISCHSRLAFAGENTPTIIKQQWSIYWSSLLLTPLPPAKPISVTVTYVYMYIHSFIVSAVFSCQGFVTHFIKVE